MPIANFKIRSWAIAKRLIGASQLAIEVCDARDLEGTRIRKLDAHLSDKLIVAATKADLSMITPGEQTMRHDGVPIFYVSSKTRAGVEKLKSYIMQRVAVKMEKGKGRYIEDENRRVVEVIIFGIPNVGKSSLINALTGRRATQTGFRSGITRGKQWINFGKNVILIDLPGLWDIRADNESMAMHAAIDVERLKDPEAAAVRVIGIFSKFKDKSLFKLYGIEESDDPEVIIERVAAKLGRLKRGGEPNIIETSKIIVRDWQKGKLKLHVSSGV